MFSWLRGALPTFSFTTNEWLLTFLEVQARSTHLKEAKGQGGKVELEEHRMESEVFFLYPVQGAHPGSLHEGSLSVLG